MVKPVFDDLTDEEVLASATEAAAAGLDAVRLAAADRLVQGPAAGLGDPAAVVQLLMTRDVRDPRWERLAPFEQRWAALVVRITAVAGMDPVAAVADARRRDVSWAALATALGVTAQSAHRRFADRVRSMASATD
ncbi:hypothetical protein [Mycobacterium servetii]|uniref:Transcriptional regulator n=1 Tax=Mycobacterium servetii TaxID=3237418 RepID=A0ABV4CC95_9MYCO